MLTQILVGGIFIVAAVHVLYVLRIKRRKRARRRDEDLRARFPAPIDVDDIRWIGALDPKDDPKKDLVQRLRVGARVRILCGHLGSVSVHANRHIPHCMHFDAKCPYYPGPHDECPEAYDPKE